MWPILRTKPIGPHLGFAIPIFIRNMQYHLTTVDAYSDGAIDVWGFVDRQLFEGKLRSGWIWPQPPEGCIISVFNLGCCICRDGKWERNAADIRDAVHRAIRINNPQMAGLLDMRGSDTELRGKVRYAKLSLADDHPVRQSAGGSNVVGREVPVFLNAGGRCILTHVFIFADGTARIGAGGELTTLDAIYNGFTTGLLTTSVPDGSIVHVEGLGSFNSSKGSWLIKPTERVKEIQDLAAELGGKADAVHRCREAMQKYEADASEANKQLLRETYEAVPEHLRVYCGDMDSKDWQIRRILYGDDTRSN